VGEDDAVTAYAVPQPADPSDVGWKRLVAAVIDVGIGAVVSTALFVAFSEDTYRYDRITDEVSYGRELTGLGALVFCGWWLAYHVGVFVLQRGVTGRTLGTMALGLTTVNARGEPPGPAMALVRSIAGIVDYLPCCLPLVGIITIFTTTGHQRVGDMAAKTYVVDARAPRPTPAPPTAPPTAPMAAPIAAAPPPAPAPFPSNPAFPPGPLDTAPTPPPKLPPVLPPVLPTGPAGVTSYAAGPAGPPPTPPPSRPAPVPRWDPARQAYVAWDPDRRQWLQFDQPSQRWLQYDPVTRQWRPVA
jgi:uncharacterized RDD family membrane protein YckC